MKVLQIFMFETKHFFRNPFKMVALLLFILASTYGLHNGAYLYKQQNSEIETINRKAEEQKKKIISHFDKNEKSPEGRPWIDFTTPFWAIWNVPTYHFKSPSPAVVYSIGQAEQYGFYKQISVWASPYDADMAEEISNPERLHTGTLDFAFAVLFLLPLLLLIMIYNLRSAEAEQGILSLIYVQCPTKNTWLISRFAFYFILLFVSIIGLMLYGALLTNVLEYALDAFFKLLGYVFLYLVFWSIIFFLIIRRGASILGNTLQMIGIWLLITFVVPGTVHQYVSIVKPVNLMTDLIDVQRDGQEELFSKPDTVLLNQLAELFPNIKKSVIFSDSIKVKETTSFSASALANVMVKKAITPIKQASEDKNRLISNSYWFNPLTFFHNQINSVAKTQYLDYENYRTDIQLLIDKRIRVMVEDMWNQKSVDKARYLEYCEQLSVLNQ